MKIEYSKNCTSDSLYYNDKDIFKMDQEQQKQIVLDLLNNVDIDFINLIKDIVELYQTNYESDNEPCEQCGHYFEKYILEI